MARTVLDLDDVALARVASLLGTRTKVDTVNQALRIVAGASDDDGQGRQFDALLDLVGQRLAETDVRAEAWR